jgi:hypothetical protein
MQLANNETDVSSCMKDKRGLMIFDFDIYLQQFVALSF